MKREIYSFLPDQKVPQTMAHYMFYKKEGNKYQNNNEKLQIDDDKRIMIDQYVNIATANGGPISEGLPMFAKTCTIPVRKPRAAIRI